MPPKTSIRSRNAKAAPDGNRDGSRRRISVNTSLTEYHAAIMQYTARGWPVFPSWPVNEDGHCACGDEACDRIGKHPIPSLAPHGLKDAATDPATIEQWWSMFPDANVCIRTGMPAGIIVMDVDAGEGWASIERLEAEHGATAATPTVATGGGGGHVFYKHPGGSIPNSRGRIAPGIDLRADGGYVVAPPSRHASGEPYRWVDGFSPDDVPLAEAPAWLFTFDTGRRESPSLKEDELITEGGRNDRLMRIGSAFRRYGLSESEIAAALHVINRTRCRPQLDEAEVGRIAASVARYEPGSSDKGVIKFNKRKPRISVVGGQVVAS